MKYAVWGIIAIVLIGMAGSDPSRNSSVRLTSRSAPVAHDRVFPGMTFTQVNGALGTDFGYEVSEGLVTLSMEYRGRFIILQFRDGILIDTVGL